MSSLFGLVFCLWYVHHSMAKSPVISTTYEWVTVDFDWNASIPMSKSEAQQSGLYVMANNIITGVKFYKHRVFVTVPRWRVGVPSTLNEVIMVNGQALLKPFPSWNMQQLNNCSALQYTQSVEIDPNNGKMWILDTGYKYFSDDASLYNNSQYVIPDSTCPAKLVIYDMDNERIEHVHVFPDSVSNHSYTFLSDIVLDVVQNRAFIADQFGTPFLGAIVVYDYNEDTSWRYADRDSMAPDGEHSSARTVTVDGVAVGADSGTASIAITPDAKYIYYAPFSSYRTYRVPTQNVVDRVFDDIEFVGNRSSQTDHITFGDEFHLYFAPLSKNAIYRIAHESAMDAEWMPMQQRLLLQNDSVLQWVDMFAWPDVESNPDDDGYLYFTTTRLQEYFTRSMDWSGANGANIRINKIKVNETSYLYYSTHDSGDGKSSLLLILAIAGGVVAVLLIALISFWCYKRSTKEKDANGFHQMLTDNSNDIQE